MTLLLSRFGIALLLLLGAPLLQANDLDAVKARMVERQPSLDALRKEGFVGENNRGYTEVREVSGNASEVSSAENRDRELVYADIARRAGSTPEQVGRARARQIAGSSAAGVWLQRESGEWYQK
ncbi:MAG: DUF1318 domain-containing protein [Opitutaceae bacterium]|nr:DUF1318 domain-containing protein [Opitutaceae bacterium]